MSFIARAMAFTGSLLILVLLLNKLIFSFLYFSVERIVFFIAWITWRGYFPTAVSADNITTSVP